MNQSSQVLERVRSVVARVTERDLSQLGPEDALDLDSIKRIVLIAELESTFEVEIEGLTPEAFESLNSLALAVVPRAAGQGQP